MSLPGFLMKTPILRTRLRKRAGQPAAPSVADLFREMVERIKDSGNDSSSATDGSPKDQVIVELEVDGTRWLLMRRLPRPTQCIVRLSEREREIAVLICKGYPNKTIASILEISLWTVGSYLRRLFAKLGVNNRAAMVAKLI